MLLYATSDVHIDSHELNWQLWQEIGRVCEKSPPDVLLIAGDLAESLDGWSRALQIFSHFSFQKLILPGNHDLWSRTESEPDSFSKYEKDLPEICNQHGWHYLPKNPWIHREIAVVGSCCWYDYSLLPGVHPFSHEELSQKRRGPVKWMDGFACSWPGISQERLDETLEEYFRGQLLQDLGMGSDPSKTLILATHFPFYQEFLRYEGISWDRAYFGAFMGSSSYRDILSSFPIKLHICGHLHRREFLKMDDCSVYLSPVGTVREWTVKDPAAHLQRVLLKLEVQNQKIECTNGA